LKVIEGEKIRYGKKNDFGEPAYPGFPSLWNVHRYGRLMRPKPLQKPISAWNAFHNNAVGYDAVILSGTVNRSRRREGGVGA
jgi:hypothetical protein